MSDLVSKLKERLALSPENRLKMLGNWPHKQMAIGSNNKYKSYVLGATDESARLQPLHEKLLKCVEALEEASEFARTDDCNGLAGEVAQEALAELRKECGE